MCMYSLSLGSIDTHTNKPTCKINQTSTQFLMDGVLKGVYMLGDSCSHMCEHAYIHASMIERL